MQKKKKVSSKCEIKVADNYDSQGSQSVKQKEYKKKPETEITELMDGEVKTITRHEKQMDSSILRLGWTRKEAPM